MRLIKPLFTFAILLTIMIVVLIIKCSDNRKNRYLEHFINQRVLEYYDLKTNPKISNEKSVEITKEIIRNTTKLNENEIQSSINELIEIYSFPIAYNERHTVINDKEHIRWVNEISSFWIPSNEDYRFAESILLKAIEENKDDSWIILNKINLKHYYRQYSFFSEKNGDSLILINAFCKVFNTPTDSCGIIIMRPFEWKNRLIIAEDGGDCFWNITINKTQNIYTDFWVNAN